MYNLHCKVKLPSNGTTPSNSLNLNKSITLIYVNASDSFPATDEARFFYKRSMH